MNRFIIVLLCTLSVAARADEAQRVLELWGAQGGPWEGHIDIYGPDGSPPTTVGLTTRWDGTPERSVLTKIETFHSDERDVSAVTLMFADAASGDIVTPYFAGGRQRDYRFAVISVSVTDDEHWTTVIASPGGEEVYEDRPASLRYVRTRRGDVIENTKEVLFLDAGDGADYELRSFIRQSLAPAEPTP